MKCSSFAKAQPQARAHVFCANLATLQLHSSKSARANRDKCTCCRAAQPASADIAAAQPSAQQTEAAAVEETEDPRNAAIGLARVAWETKAEDLMVLHVADQVSWCSYMVFATIFSRPQLNAVLGKMETAAKEQWGREPRPAGGRSAWEILDLGDIIVHVLSAEMRDYYQLEAFYADSEEVSLPFVREEREGEEGAVWSTRVK